MAIPLGQAPPLPGSELSESLNGSTAADRWQIRELMEGFPSHRDACEWPKMRALFASEDAYVFTTWSGGVPIDEFIKISAAGFAKGARIAHRVCGGTVDIATGGPAAGKRALGKLKATITQRFIMKTDSGEDCEVDVDADCRLCFFVARSSDGEWKAHFFKGFYEKDKMIPVDPRKVPAIDYDKLSTFPAGYRWLAYGQSATHKIKLDLPQSEGLEHDAFYRSFISWLEGASIDEMKKQLGV